MNISQIIKKIWRNKSLLNGALFSVFSFVNQGFSFLLLLILANYITPEEYGSLSLFSTTMMVMMYFMAMSTQGYLGISYFRESSVELKETFSCIFLTSICMCVLYSVIVLLGGEKLSDTLNLPQTIIFAGIAICFFTILSQVNLDYFRLQEKVKIYGILSCGNALLNFILSIIFVKTFLWGWQGRVWAQLVCFCAFGIFGLYCFIRRKSFVRPNWSHWKKMLMWGIPLIPHLATDFLRQGCDRYIINSSHTLEDVGLFSFALTLANIISMIGYGFNQSNSVDIYKTLGDDNLTNQQKFDKVAKQRHLFAGFYMASAIVVFLICYFVMPIILPRYADSLQYFPILAIYGFLICVYLIYTNFLFFYKKTKKLMYITLGSSIVHLLLSLCLTRYSLYITASIYVLSELLIVLIVRIVAKKILVRELAQ